MTRPDDLVTPEILDERLRALERAIVAAQRRFLVRTALGLLLALVIFVLLLPRLLP